MDLGKVLIINLKKDDSAYHLSVGGGRENGILVALNRVLVFVAEFA